MINITYIATEDMNNKLKLIKGKTKLNFYKNLSSYYDEMNIRRKVVLFNLKKILLVKM